MISYICIWTHSRNSVCVLFEHYSWNNLISRIANILWSWKTALFLVVTQLVGVIPYRRFGTTYRVPSSSVKNPTGTSVRNYHYSLRNNPLEGSSHLLHGGSLKLRMILLLILYGCGDMLKCDSSGLLNNCSFGSKRHLGIITVCGQCKKVMFLLW
jgi:hypothetical protein